MAWDQKFINSVKRNLKSTFIVALLVLAACGENSKIQSLQHLSSGIVGGQVAEVSDFPWQVSIQSKNGDHFCGGSIIAKRAVLTAAHCLDHESVERIQVRGGGSNGRLQTQKIFPRVKKIIVHPNWTGGYEEQVNHDIALILFENDIPLDNNTRIIKLPEPSLAYFSISHYFSSLSGELIASGWGQTKEEGSDESQLKSYEVLPLAGARDSTFWNESTSYQYIFADLGRRMLGGNFLVSYTPGASTCSGDSGGPLVVLPGQVFSEPVLIGLTSAGGDIACSSSVFHTDVQSYLNWIKSNL